MLSAANEAGRLQHGLELAQGTAMKARADRAALSRTEQSTDKHSRLAEPVRTRSSASTSQRAYLRRKGDMFNCSSMPSVAASCVRFQYAIQRPTALLRLVKNRTRGEPLKSEAPPPCIGEEVENFFTCNGKYVPHATQSRQSSVQIYGKLALQNRQRQGTDSLATKTNNPCVSIFSPRMLCADYQVPFIGQYLHAFCTHR